MDKPRHCVALWQCNILRGAKPSELLIERLSKFEFIMGLPAYFLIGQQPRGLQMADAAHSERKYDRDFLLSPEKRNQLVKLLEVEKYGRDCFGDPDHVHLYGMKPKEWYGQGVRILARTCLEAVKDPLGEKIGSDIAEIVGRVSGKRPIGVVDPFAGSCNVLYAIVRRLAGSKGIGFEVEPTVFDLTSRNIAHLKAPIQLV